MTEQEVADVMYYLDDPDLIHAAPLERDQPERVLNLWGRMRDWYHRSPAYGAASPSPRRGTREDTDAS